MTEEAVETIEPTLEDWRRFATCLWMEAQAMAEDLGDAEELFESMGYQAQALGLKCDFVPEDEEEEES